MKKISILLMLMALFGPLAMNGQTRTELTVADQTGTSSYVPFYGLYVDDYQHNQTIYPSTMLTQMQGGQITKLTYYLNSSVTKEYGATIEIRLGTTTSTAFSTGTVNYISISGNPVYTNTNLSVSGTTVEFDFSNNPYTYTSGNLVVDVRITSPGGWAGTTWLGESASTVYSAYGYGSSMPSQGNGLTFMPKTTFTYTATSNPQIVLNPSSATVLTGSTQTLTATTLNVTGTPTISYSSSNTNVATVSGSGTSATVTAVAPGTATITATMTYNGNTYTATSAITVEDPSYCTPGTGGYDNSGISNVTFGTNPGVNNTVGGIAYGNYSNLVGAVSAGATCQVDITYKTGYTYGTIIWVDWNHNYTFEGTEAVYAGTSGSNNPTTLNASFVVPAATSAGDYRMRIIGSDSGLDNYVGSLSAAANADPCGSYSYSTCHDYTLRVSSDPSITLNPTSATVFTGFTQALTASYVNVTGTPTITYSTSDASVATVSGSGTTATVTGIAPGTATITATMNGSYTATCAITVEDPYYCTPNPSSRDGKGITTLTFGSGDYTVNNSDSNGLPNSSPYYADYTSMVGGYEPGETATVTITYSTGTSTVYSYGTLIWVDWNKNYTFEDSEIVYTGTSAQGSNGTPQVLTATFTVPANQAADDYRMRIAGADSYFDDYIGGSSSANHDPCFSSTYAVCHDYTLRVVATGAYTITCATTTGGTISANKNNADENDVVTITATPETDYLLTALTYTPEGGSAQNIDITSTPYTFTMPAANVTVNATFSLPACPRPTNLTVSNLAASHATVSWDSEAGNYTVKYSTATVDGTTLDPVFEDGFESGIGNWTIYAMGYNGSDYNWQQYDGTLVDEGNHTGDYVAASRSWTSSGGDQSVDNWLVTPQMTLGDVVKFWVACNDGFRDSYAVYVSTGSNVVTSSTSIGDFVLVKSYAEATGTWTEIPVDISAYAGQQGYVAIRHTNYGGDHIMVDDFGVFNTINTYSYGGWTTVSPNPTTESCQLTGLSAETLYEVQVQANCGGTDGSSAWSTIRFTTPDNCGAPQELASSNVTINSATLSWADDKDSYNLQYRKVYFYEDFEGSDGIPTGWTTINNSSTAGSLNWQVLHLTNHSGNNSVGSGSYIYQNTGITPDNWLISPQLDLQGTLRVWLTGYGDRYAEHFEILLSTTGTSVSDFTTTLVAESTTTNSYVEYTADLSSYTGKGYIAIHHFNCSDQNYLCVDDFGIYGSENWVTLTPNPTTETANLTGLTPIIENDYHLLPTTYEWQVQGVNCDGNGGTTEWSDVATFSTPEGYILPITGYGTSAGGYYLIASPINATVDPENVTSMLSNAYDLYAFDQTGGGNNREWRNYKANSFNLEPGQGYLYANSANVDLVFTGSAYQGSTFDVTLTKAASPNFEGWNLVGNPFAETAYITTQEGHTLNFYTLTAAGDEFEAATNTSVERMEGVFVVAQEDGEEITFTKGEGAKGSLVALNLSNGRNIIDRAIVRFDECRQLPKFQLNQNHTKVYIPVEGQDYAVVRGEEMGAMPVNFKAESNGTYSLSLSTDNVEFAYLHLIDNLTGNDVDLLQTPSYSFEAKTTDYTSRFKLVFATGSSTGSEAFAYFCNGSFVINNEGNATLQVIDVNGRIIKSESINGCTNVNVNAAPGVYMIRLVNGDNVKVQKVVVK